jgi:hypothetical protein
MQALYVNLMPKDQDLGYQRSSRPEQPDQRRPNKAAGFPHRTDALRDSAPAVSPIRFTTGTGIIEHPGARIFDLRELGWHIRTDKNSTRWVLVAKPAPKQLSLV